MSLDTPKYTDTVKRSGMAAGELLGILAGGALTVVVLIYTGLQLAAPQISIVQVVFGVLLTAMVTGGFMLWRRIEAIGVQLHSRLDSWARDAQQRDLVLAREFGELQQVSITNARDIAGLGERVSDVGSKITALTIERLAAAETRHERAIAEVRIRQDELREDLKILKGRPR